MNSNEIKGIQLSQAVKWSGQDIFEVASAAFEDANYHSFNEVFMPHGLSSRRSYKMAKKLQNMTHDERIAYWENVREKERIHRETG